MDLNLLVDEILARVSEKLTDISKTEAVEKPKLLILTDSHGTDCHDILEQKELLLHYDIDCALQKDYHCELKEYQAIIMYHLSINALNKIAAGICNTPFLSLAVEALLHGKKIYIPEEEIELFQYKQTAANAYYSMMDRKLNLLCDSGVIICKSHSLVDALVGGLDVKQEVPNASSIQNKEVKSATICKKVITESDIRKLSENGITVIYTNSNAILTDVAKEYIHTKGIDLIKESSADRKPGKRL